MGDERAVRILVMPGSMRAGSYNLRLARHAAARLEAQGARPTLIDLRALALPIYDGDLEAAQGVPAGAQRLVRDLAAHDALLVVSPEYNAFPPPLLVNAIDWATRLPEHKAAMNGKPTALISASPGALGGMRSLMALRNFLAINPGLLVLPQQATVSLAERAFDDDGGLRDARQDQAVAAALAALIEVTRSLRAGRAAA